MKKITKWLFVAIIMLGTTAMFSQGKLTGVVKDNNGVLPGASVIVKGTSVGTTTNFDGKFTLDVKTAKGTLEVSYLGYTTKNVSFSVANGSKDLGTITLVANSENLDEIVITSVIDIAKDRQTPVAVSTIRAVEIQERLGSQEFPELLNSTPSVYATKSGGGFGDSRVNIRGFDQKNTAVLINGMPVNDMENGWVYWSNWAGLSDVTSAIQVQRGLGSSKLAISSVGGTINVITRTSDQKEGGAVTTTMGNDNYQKYVASYSTGLMNNGFSASFVLSRTTGDGYIQGTAFEGHNYFIGLGQELNDKHSLMFTFTGAPQWHHQNSRAIEIWRSQDYGIAGEPNRKFNDAYGSLNGKEFSFRRNFYHKPVMSLNWDWKLGDNSTLGTVVYGSWGRGGGSGPIGDVNNIRDYDYRLKDSNGHYRMDDIVKWNSGGHVADFGADRTSTINDNTNGLSLRSSMNSHNWYGIISNYHKDVNENLSWDLGIDARTYKGIHYRVVSDLLGATGYVDNKDKNNPNRPITSFVDPTPSWNPFQNITNQQKIEYYNDGGARWLGLFGQVEYKTEKTSMFVQAGASNQSFQRVDYFNLGDFNGTQQASSWKAIKGGNIKGGLNYNIDEHNNIFGNVGYYSKQPLWSSVYQSFSTNVVTPNLTNEKVVGLEFGYAYTTEKYNVKINLYNTSWKDRFFRKSITGQDGYIDFNGINEVHRGVEFEGNMKAGNLELKGMYSYGDWQYKGNVNGTEYDGNNNVVGQSGTTFYLDKVRVGDAAQTTVRLMLKYSFNNGVKFDVSQSYYGRLYAAIDAGSFSKADNQGSLQLPGYSLVDAGISYKFKLKSDVNSIDFRLNVNNLMNDLYMSESQTNIFAKAGDETFMGINTKNRVYWGFGRTWNASVKFNF